ncbi:MULTISPECIES: exodeoxyribonuclease VII small subunit [Hallella]|jgi:exodeoxyribonuclease VII small subunit|uniref:Exodeoxyribonuclease 7 small subunit n=1 Tax=Hallella mizrahii TaxID=2606637 RepID=A0A7K0KB87_9BACT|nr:MULTISPECIES: exodeoxyribonuclease VII small subunit [Hallella]MST83109.1 exodeoxyribonuclease VII small subunit [Hallella mizrahii]
MKAIKYEDAIRQLEDIVEKLENNELDIDEMPEALKRAQQLLKLCRDRLTKTDAEIQKIQEEAKDAPNA